ncbi:MAG TPA: hypothetical protein VIW45_11435, partial [Vicinamibacterales bacterium]
MTHDSRTSSRDDPTPWRRLALWLFATWLLLELFVIFDWDAGLRRLALLVALGGWLVWCRRGIARCGARERPSRAWMH